MDKNSGKKIDLATICFGEELGLLALQARSVRLYMDQAVLGTIHLVVNDKNFTQIEKHIRTHILPEYGGLASRVRIYSYFALTNNMRIKKLGWRSQQALKLLISQHIENPTYLILDSKNHFIRAVAAANFWQTDGRLKIAPTPIYKRFMNDYIQARRYFGLPKIGRVNEGSVISGTKEPAWPAVTPFPVAAALVRKMIETLEQSQKKSFIEIFMKGPRVTEFYLLYAYLEAAYGGFVQFYAAAPRTSFPLMASTAGAPKKVDDIIAKLAAPDVICFGVHRTVLQAKNPAILQSIATTWQRYGLVESEAEAQRFLVAMPLSGRDRFWHRIWRRFWIF